jgi:hypothetical protein
VAALWRFPVKSMQGEPLEQVELIGRGVVGDRTYALIDRDTSKVVSAKSVRLFPDVLACRAAFVASPHSGHDLPPVRISLPNGDAVTSDTAGVDDVLSAFFGRAVMLAQAAPDDYTIDQDFPQIDGLESAGYRDTVVEQKLGSAFFAEAGMASPVPAGAFVDLFPLSVLTTSTLERLSALRPQSRFDQRRFRMNVIVSTDEPGFVENDWVGREMTIGGAVRLQVVMPDPRCVMTTLAQDGLAKDADVLRALAQHNRVQVAGGGLDPCAGVYAVINTAGTIRIGDSVAIG